MAIGRYINIGMLRVAILSALLSVACSKDSMEPEQSPITFEIANADGWNNLTRGTSLTQAQLCKDGFGIFAFYTKEKPWTEYSSSAGEPNFINNTKATSSDNGSTWAYSPRKYWPHDQQDKVSFFAYAPYHASQTISGTTIGYDITRDVDLCWSTSDTRDLNQNTQTATSGKVKFTFRHALARIGFTVQAKTDNVAGLKEGVTIRIKELILTSPADNTGAGTGVFHKSGMLNLFNQSDNAAWTSKSAETAKIDLNHTDFAGKAADGLTLNKANATTAVKLNAEDGYVMVIPQDLSTTGFNVILKYEVELKDLLGIIYSTYTNTGVATVKVNLQDGQAYTLNMTIDIETATFDADIISIVPWEDNEDDVIIPDIVV